MSSALGSSHAALSAHCDALASQLRVFCGHRTLWIDEASGRLVHAEPDDLLEAQGLRYVATVLAPDREQLIALLAGRLQCVPDPTPSAVCGPSAGFGVATPALA